MPPIKYWLGGGNTVYRYIQYQPAYPVPPIVHAYCASATGVSAHVQNGDALKLDANPAAYGRSHGMNNSNNYKLPDDLFETGSVASSSSSDSLSAVSPFSFRALSRRKKFLLAILCLGELCSNIMVTIIVPFFPSEAHAKGVSDTVSGWIFGILPLAQIIFSPIVGSMMKPAGVKFIFLSGTFVSGLSTILFGVADRMPGLLFVVHCFAMHITMAWGFASFTTATFVIIAQEFGDNVSQVFGITETFCGVGCALGPAIGGLLYSWGGFGLPFYVVGAVYLLTVPLSWPLLPSDAEVHDCQVSSLTLLKLTGILMMLWIVVVLATVWCIFEPVLEPRLKLFSLTPQLIGLIFLLTAASYGISAPIFGCLTERIPDLNILILISMAGCTACLAMLGPSPLFVNSGGNSGGGGLALIIVSLALLGLFNSMGVVPSYEYMLDAAERAGLPDDVAVHGAIGGLWGSAYALGEFIGPIAGGFLVDVSSFPWAMTAGSGLALVTLSLLLIFVLAQRYRNRRAARRSAANAAASRARPGPPQPVPFRRRSVSFLRATSLQHMAQTPSSAVAAVAASGGYRRLRQGSLNRERSGRGRGRQGHDMEEASDGVPEVDEAETPNLSGRRSRNLSW